MERTTPTSEPGAVGSGGDSPGGSQGTPPTANWETLDDTGKISRVYQQKCEDATVELAKVLPQVHAFVTERKAAGRLWHWCYPLKLLELWDILNREKPTSIIELGSGCTTLVFAEYCDQRGINFVSVDENAEWQAEIRSKCASRSVEWRVHPAMWVAGRSAICYHNLNVSQSFVYVDGPSNKIKDGCAICIDVLDGMKRGAIDTVLFDIRRETVRFLQDETTAYHWDLSVWSAPTIPWYLSGIRHHTVARRKA